MTEKLYEQDGELLSFCATVTDCKEEDGCYQIALDKSAFSPNAGGQSADIGTLNGIAVTDVRELDGILWHTTDAPIAPGETVKGEVDADLRWHHIQNHAGEHIISALLWQTYGFHNVGFHLGEKVVTMDVDGALSLSTLLPIEARANEIVWENHPIRCYYPKKEELKDLDYRSKLDLQDNVRIVEIEGVDKCACCAPHPRSTAQIGLIKILSAISYKGGTRITLLCGRAALALWNRERALLSELSHRLSLPHERLVEGVEALLDHQTQYKIQLHALQQKELTQLQKTAEQTNAHQAWFLSPQDERAARQFCQEMLCKTDGVCCVMWENEDACRIILTKDLSHPFDAKTFFQTLNVKGGGKGALFQGSISCEKSALVAHFASDPDWILYDKT